MNFDTPTKIVIMLPTRNVAHVLQSVWSEFPPDLKVDFLIVDDFSDDGTSRLANELKIPSIVHVERLGQGAVQKTLLRHVLQSDYDILVQFIPNGAFTPKDIPLLIDTLQSKKADVVVGTVSPASAWRDADMPALLYYREQVFSLFWRTMLGLTLRSFHPGIRVYRADALRSIPWTQNSNGQLFNVELFAQLQSAGATIEEVPITLQGYAPAEPLTFMTRLKLLSQQIRLAIQYTLHNSGLRTSSNFQRQTPTDNSNS